MLTVGVDLAAADERTGLAELAWSPGRAVLRRLTLGAGDRAIVEAAAGADKTGIDCALGWPVPFLDLMTEHRTGHAASVPGPGEGSGWRRRMVYRTTDEAVRSAIPGLVPLSVSADRLAHAALRCAGILSMLAAAGVDVDRSGTGAIVEAYPSASLYRWGLTHRGYKPSGAPVDALAAAAPWLELGPHEALMRTSHDAFDAVIAALTARAAALGRTAPPPPEHLATARIEGWIAIPDATLDELL